MANARNQHWLNLNAQRAYPLDEGASLTSDAGRRLPPDIVADLNLRFPTSLGRFAYVASVSVTPKLATVLILSSESEDSASGGSPLAAISLRLDNAAEGVNHRLEALSPGVVGWIVFGSGIREAFSGRFSSPAQSRLAPKAARPYRPAGVLSVGKAGADSAMTGVVRLSASSPLVLSSPMSAKAPAPPVLIAGWEIHNAVIVSLNQEPVGGPDVFAAYAGPCGKRVENGDCPDGPAVEFINTVAPNCDGEIVVRFAGCAVIGSLDGECGVVIDCELSLADACSPKYLPDENGVLPGEYDDLCAESDSDSEGESEPSEEPPPESEDSADSEEPGQAGSLPYRECFNDQEADFWEAKGGVDEFGFVADDSPDDPCVEDWILGGDCLTEAQAAGLTEEEAAELAEGCDFGSEGPGSFSYTTELTDGAAFRNVSVWEGFNTQVLDRRATINIKLLAFPGTDPNAGVVINYRESQTAAGQYQYYLAWIDSDTQTLRVSWFNGLAMSAIPGASVGVLGLTTGAWYRLTAEVVEVSGNLVINASVEDLANPLVSASLSLVPATHLSPDEGVFGVHANRAHARFSFFRVEEI